jgi:hypothetical protein
MTEMYLVSIRWVTTEPDVQTIDGLLNTATDWFRLNGLTWLVWTDEPRNALALRIKARLKPEDSVIILKVDPTKAAGWAPPELWNWLNDKNKPYNALARALMGKGPPP